MIAHNVFAGLSRCPEFKLSDQEAQDFAEPMAVIMGKRLELTDEQMAWIGLGGAAAAKYTSALGAIAERQRAEKAKNVTPNTPFGGSSEAVPPSQPVSSGGLFTKEQPPMSGGSPKGKPQASRAMNVLALNMDG